jgi:hypothetical protein
MKSGLAITCMLSLMFLLPWSAQVRKLMLMVEGQQQAQEQQAHQDKRERHCRYLVEALLRILDKLSWFDEYEGASDAWLGLARPTVAVLEHVMHRHMAQQAQEAGEAASWRQVSATFWQTFSRMLWINPYAWGNGPLLAVASAEAAAAASGGSKSAGAAVMAVAAGWDDAAAHELPAAAPAQQLVSSQLFSLCIGANNNNNHSL